MRRLLIFCIGLLIGVCRLYADEHYAAFIQNVFIEEAEKILRNENDYLDTEMNRAPRPDAPAISHPIYPVGPLQGPQGPQGKPGPAGNGLASCGPFKLLEAATSGDVVRLVPDPTNQLGTKAAIRKIKKGPLFDWATRAGNFDPDGGVGIATDCQGNVYITGGFAATVTFGNNITLVSNGAAQDMVVAKLNPTTGEWVWATRAGSTDADSSRSIATDCQDNVYITGNFLGTITFGNNITLVSKESSPGVFSNDIVVAKLNQTTGEWVWATRAGGTSTNDQGNGIATDCQGNVYVTGGFSTTVTFGNSITLTSAGSTDIFVAKLNPTNGEWVWATRAGASGGLSIDQGNAVATDCQGNVFVTGSFRSTVTFGNTITLTSASSTDIFVAKLNPTNGEWVWATRAGQIAGGTGADSGNGIATDCQGNVYVTGSFTGTVTFGNNITLVSNSASTDIFAAKLNPTNGEWVWATRAGSSVSNDSGKSITTDCQGNVYVTGIFSDTITFGNNITLVSKETSPGIFSIDIFAAKLNATTGEWVWATRTGGINDDSSNAVTTDCQGNVFVTGFFVDTVTFGNNITLVSNSASNDIFVTKIIDDERSLKTHGILQEGGAAGTYKNALFSGLFVSPLSSLVPAADYYVDSSLTLTSCCCHCNCCCDANFKFVGTACSPTGLILRNCC